ncbi:MAG: hypothetical protein JWL84_6003 [Rhodospirillales bacterium]|nr:hypothetical protein [Rhodospirillales bacterium]
MAARPNLLTIVSCFVVAVTTGCSQDQSRSSPTSAAVSGSEAADAGGTSSPSAQPGQQHGFYKYLGRVSESGPSTPFVGAVADDASQATPVIGWTTGGPPTLQTKARSAHNAMAAEEASGSSSPPAAIASALPVEALARAAIRSLGADRSELRKAASRSVAE